MGVSKQTILHKIKKELDQAVKHETNDQKVQKHLSHIKLLCELMIEENEQDTMPDKHAVYSNQEKVFIKNDHLLKEDKHSTVDHDGANGPSIFDF